MSTKKSGKDLKKGNQLDDLDILDEESEEEESDFTHLQGRWMNSYSAVKLKSDNKGPGIWSKVLNARIPLDLMEIKDKKTGNKVERKPAVYPMDKMIYGSKKTMVLLVEPETFLVHKIHKMKQKKANYPMDDHIKCIAWELKADEKGVARIMPTGKDCPMCNLFNQDLSVPKKPSQQLYVFGAWDYTKEEFIDDVTKTKFKLGTPRLVIVDRYAAWTQILGENKFSTSRRIWLVWSCIKSQTCCKGN